MSSPDFVELRDDRGLQPAENITPLVRNEVLNVGATMSSHRSTPSPLELTTVRLRLLNAEVGGDTTRCRRIAAAWLTEQGLT